MVPGEVAPDEAPPGGTVFPRVDDGAVDVVGSVVRPVEGAGATVGFEIEHALATRASAHASAGRRRRLTHPNALLALVRLAFREEGRRHGDLDPLELTDVLIPTRRHRLA